MWHLKENDDEEEEGGGGEEGGEGGGEEEEEEEEGKEKEEEERNLAVECVELRTRQIPSSNIDPESDYSEVGFCGFSKSSDRFRDK